MVIVKINVYLILVVFTIIGVFNSPLLGAEWNSFQGDSSNSGYVSAISDFPLNHDFVYETGGDILSSPIIAGDLVIFGSRDFNLYAIDINTGLLKWKYRTSGPVDSTALYDNGFVYFGSRDGKLYCVRATDGKLSFRFDAEIPISSSLSMGNGKIYFITETDYRFIALDKLSGDLIFDVNLDQPVQSAPVFYNDNVYVATNSGRLYCLSGTDGSIVFSQDTDGDVGLCSPSIKDGKLYFAPGGLDNKLYVFDATTGNPEWTYNGGATGVSPSPTNPGFRFGMSHVSRIPNFEKSLVNRSPSMVKSLSAAPSNYFVAYVDPNLVFNSQTVVADSGKAYFITGYPTATLVAVDLATHAMSWNYSLGIFPEPMGHYGAPLITDNEILVTDSSGTLLIFDKTNGSLLSNIPLFGTSYSSFAVSENNILALTKSGKLISLVTGPDSSLELTDTTDPIISVSKPLADSTVDTSNPEIFVYLYDADSGINTTETTMIIDGNNIVYNYSRMKFYISHTVTGLADGNHNITVNTKDLAGNTASKSWNFNVLDSQIVDNTPPVFTDFLPVPGSTISYTKYPVISVKISDDDGSGVDKNEIQLYFEGKIVKHFFNSSNGLISFQPSLPVLDGVHTVSVIGKDVAGNLSESASWNFTVSLSEDLGNPTISDLSPAMNNTVTNTRLPEISFKLTDEDSGIDVTSIVLKLDNELLDANFDSSTGIVTATPLSSLSNGNYNLKVFASDVIGNAVEIDNWPFSVNFNIGATNIRVATITSDSAIISWITNPEAEAKVYYSANSDLSNSILKTDVRNASFKGYNHSVLIDSLNPGTDYYFKIESISEGESEIKSNNNNFFHFKTTTSDSGNEFLVNGVVEKNSSALENILVYLTVYSETKGYLMPLQVISDGSGEFSFNMKNLKDKYGNVANLESGDVLRIFAQGGETGIGFSPLTYNGENSPYDAGKIEIGKTVNYPVALTYAFNLVGVPVTSDSPLTSYDLIDNFNGLKEIGKYESVSQTFETAATIFGSTSGTLFNLQSGSGYFMNLLNNANLIFTGAPSTVPESIIIRNGLNLISFPYSEEALDKPLVSNDSYEFLELSNDLTEIHVFNEVTQKFEESAFKLLDGIRGNKFNLELDKAYYVRSTNTSSITPSGKSEFIPEENAAVQNAPSRFTMARNVARILSHEIVNVSSTGFDVVVELDNAGNASVSNDEVTYFSVLGKNRISKIHLIRVSDYNGKEILVRGGEDIIRINEIKKTVSGSAYPFLITGLVFDTAQNPVKNSVVEVEVKIMGKRCLKLASLTDVDGRWYLNLANLKYEDGTRAYVSSGSTMADVKIKTETGGKGESANTISGVSPVIFDDVYAEGGGE